MAQWLLTQRLILEIAARLFGDCHRIAHANLALLPVPLTDEAYRGIQP